MRQLSWADQEVVNVTDLPIARVQVIARALLDAAQIARLGIDPRASRGPARCLWRTPATSAVGLSKLPQTLAAPQ